MVETVFGDSLQPGSVICEKQVLLLPVRDEAEGRDRMLHNYITKGRYQEFTKGCCQEEDKMVCQTFLWVFVVCCLWDCHLRSQAVLQSEFYFQGSGGDEFVCCLPLLSLFFMIFLLFANSSSSSDGKTLYFLL